MNLALFCIFIHARAKGIHPPVASVCNKMKKEKEKEKENPPAPLISSSTIFIQSSNKYITE